MQSFEPMCRVPDQRWLLLFVLLLSAMGCAGQLRPWEEMKQRHATTTARVTGTNCPDHGNVSYEFLAGGRTYVGKTNQLGKPCESVRPGEQLLVNFHPEMPGINSSMSPEDAYEHHRFLAYMPLYFAGAWVLGLVVFVFSSLREISTEDALISSQRKRGNPPPR